MTTHGQTRNNPKPPDPLANEKWHLRFRFRCETSVFAWYSRRDLPYSLLLRRALLRFLEAVNAGMIDTLQVSRFLARTDISDKVETSARLTLRQKDILEKLAFTLRSSQAEILRMALEWYMEAISPLASAETQKLAREKWHHGVPEKIAAKCEFLFWQPFLNIHYRHPPPPGSVTVLASIAPGL